MENANAMDFKGYKIFLFEKEPKFKETLLYFGVKIVKKAQNVAYEFYNFGIFHQFLSH